MRQAMRSSCNLYYPCVLQVAAVHLHPEPFSVENGMMTPTFKLKRPQAQTAFQHAIDGALALSSPPLLLLLLASAGRCCPLRLMRLLLAAAQLSHPPPRL